MIDENQYLKECFYLPIGDHVNKLKVMKITH